MIDKKFNSYNFLVNHKGIYKFYVEETLLNIFIKELELINKINKDEIETLKYKKKNAINETTYYCVYVGKTDAGFYSRIIEGHFSKSTTLKRTVRGILEKAKIKMIKFKDEECIFTISQSFKIDEDVDLESYELKEINSSFHVLNLDDNKYYLDSKTIDSYLIAKQLRK